MGCVDIIVTLKNRQKQKKKHKQTRKWSTQNSQEIPYLDSNLTFQRFKKRERLYFKIIDFYNSLLNKTNLLIFLSLSRFLFRPWLCDSDDFLLINATNQWVAVESLKANIFLLILKIPFPLPRIVWRIILIKKY